MTNKLKLHINNELREISTNQIEFSLEKAISYYDEMSLNRDFDFNLAMEVLGVCENALEKLHDNNLNFSKEEISTIEDMVDIYEDLWDDFENYSF